MKLNIPELRGMTEAIQLLEDRIVAERINAEEKLAPHARVVEYQLQRLGTAGFAVALGLFGLSCAIVLSGNGVTDGKGRR